MGRRTFVKSVAVTLITRTFGFSQSAKRGVVIEVSLPGDRTKMGTLALKHAVSGEVLLADIHVLGKASNSTAKAKNNNGANQLKPYGDTPSGGYVVSLIQGTGSGTGFPTSSYGSAGAIRMVPVSGNALIAKSNGRKGLLIHSGRDAGLGKSLVRTNGCLRVHEEDLKRMIEVITKTSLNAGQNRCEVLEIKVSVGDGSGEDNIDEGDPPPEVGGTRIILN